MALTTYQTAQMTSIIGQLEVSYAKLKAFHSGAWYVGGGAASGEQALYVARRMIDYLRGEMWHAVAAGTKTYAAWIQLANDAGTTLHNANTNLPATTWSAATQAAAVDAGVTSLKLGTIVGIGAAIYFLGPLLWTYVAARREIRRARSMAGHRRRR